MGNVRPEKVKRIARELIRRYPDKFTANFEENKKILSSIAYIPSIRLRNSIAGYITRLVSLSQPHSGENSIPQDKK
ncbi:MAG: 30S ribosomal protein S17e [Candidatus Bathyarchaeia archaeon]